MPEIIFLWFGIASILIGKDMWDRGNDQNGVVVMILGIAGIVYYIVSVFTLPAP